MTNKIKVTELDFDTIKNSIKIYLSTKPEFTDYDFDGSALSVIIDTLAYNTYYNSVYLNMMFNESYLDTAIKRTNVISHALDIGYSPRSITAPKTLLNVSLPVGSVGTAQITYPKGTKFTTSVNGRSFTYTTIEDYTSATPHTNFDIVAYEGRLHTQTMTFVDGGRYILENPNVDTQHISVTVGGETYNTIDDLLAVTSTSKIFLIRDVNGYVEIIFGDGTLGEAPPIDEDIVVNYLTTSGADSNKATSFAPQNSVDGFEISVNGATISTGGSYPETLESVKYLAPLFYASQNRMVTKEDHLVLTKKHFTNIESISIWGGEENIPAQYGSVFVSIKPIVGELLTTLERDEVLTIMRKYGIMTNTYVYQDPEFIYIKPTIQVKYDPTKTSKTKNDIQTSVTNAVSNYGDTVLEKFLTYFRYSDFLTNIDDVDSSISSNLTSIKIEKRQTIVTVDTDLVMNVNFDNKLVAGSINTQYYRDAEFDSVKIIDDGKGTIQTIDVNEEVKEDIGTVNYETGLITFTKLHVRTFLNDDTSLNFEATPEEFDIIPARNQILSIDDSQIQVNIENV